MRTIGFALATLSLALATAPAGRTQSALLFAVHDPQVLTAWQGVGMGALDRQEVALAQVEGGVITARPFLSRQNLHAFQGDPEGLGDYTPPFLVGAVDALLITAAERQLPARARRPYLSVARRAMPLFDNGQLRWLDHASLFRWLPNGGVQVFLTRAQLHRATGLTSPAVDLDAICQDSQGNLYFSLALDAPAGQPLIRAGDLCRIPASAITWNPDGTVASLVPLSAKVIATAADLDVMVANSGLADPTGGRVTAIGNLSALAIDPGGGTFIPPAAPGLGGLPNLLFAGNAPNWALGICSTAGGGSLGILGGLPLGSTGTTTGAHLAVADPQGGAASSGLGALALTGVPGEEIRLQEDQGGRFPTATGQVVFSFAGAEPQRRLFLLITPGPAGPGAWIPSFPTLPGLFTGNGEAFLAGPFLLALDLGLADGRGAGGITLTLPAGVPGPAVMVAQAFGPVTGGGLSLSLPVVLQWF